MLSLSLGFIIGIILGSFIACLANRSLTNKSFWKRSYCDNCKKQLVWYDLIPIFSFLILKGKSRCCKKKLSKELILVEVLTGLLISLLFFLNLPANFYELTLVRLILILADLAFKSFIVVILISIVITDLKENLIPDRITYPAAALAFSYLLIVTISKSTLFYFELKASELGKYLLPPYSDYFFRQVFMGAEPLIYGVISGLGLGLFFLILILVTRGRGMGGGDMKLGVFLGLVFGFPQSVVVLMLAFLTGSLFGIILIIFGKKKFGQTIPFGPFLALGGLLSLYWGEKILNWYLQIPSFLS